MHLIFIKQDYINEIKYLEILHSDSNCCNFYYEPEEFCDDIKVINNITYFILRNDCCSCKYPQTENYKFKDFFICDSFISSAFVYGSFYNFCGVSYFLSSFDNAINISYKTFEWMEILGTQLSCLVTCDKDVKKVTSNKSKFKKLVLKHKIKKIFL